MNPEIFERMLSIMVEQLIYEVTSICHIFREAEVQKPGSFSV